MVDACRPVCYLKGMNLFGKLQGSEISATSRFVLRSKARLILWRFRCGPLLHLALYIRPRVLRGPMRKLERFVASFEREKI